MMKNNTKELEFAGGNDLELDEYISSEEFEQEMKELKMPISVDNGEQIGY